MATTRGLPLKDLGNWKLTNESTAEKVEMISCEIV